MEKAKEIFNKVKTALFRYFTANDELSWVSHGLIAGLAATILYLFNMPAVVVWGVPTAFYLYREIKNMVDWKKKPKNARRKFWDKMNDGIVDFTAPCIYSGIIASAGVLWGWSVLVIVSGLIWYGGERKRRKDEEKKARGIR